MAKKIFIVHGWSGYPEEGWFPWLKKELERKKFKVEVPLMPDTDKPEIKSWISHLTKVLGNLNENTYLVGHSIGCQAILRYLETLENKIKINLVLVAPWMHLDEETIKEEGEESMKIAKPWIETPIDFNKEIIDIKEKINLELNTEIKLILIKLKDFLSQKDNKENKIIQKVINYGFPIFGNNLYYEPVL